MSEHEVDYAPGCCSQGCRRPATTRVIRLERGIEIHTPYCQPCQDQEIFLELALQDEPKTGGTDNAPDTLGTVRRD